MMGAMDLHDQILHAAIRRRSGDPFRHTGDGVLAIFERPRDAVLAAIDAQRELRGAASCDSTNVARRRTLIIQSNLLRAMFSTWTSSLTLALLTRMSTWPRVVSTGRRNTLYLREKRWSVW
jgi:hypothetical protein